VAGTPSPTWSRTLRAAAASAGLRVTERDVADQSTARHAVEHGDVDVAVVFGDRSTVIAKDAQNRMIPVIRQSIAVEHIVATLRDAGLAEPQIEQALSPPDVRIDEIQSDRSGQVAAASVISLGVYLLLFMVTAAVANAVAIEKANRVSEVLLAIVPPRVLLYGKIIGIGLVGMIPFIAGAVPVVIKLAGGGTLPPGTGSALAAGAVWFVLGAAIYLLSAGALGALVERQEEVGSAMTSLSVLLVSSYIIGQSAADSGLGAALAFVPFSAPMVEPARLALGLSSPAEVGGALAASCIGVLIMGRVGSAIYRRAIVHTGARLKLHEVLRLSR
jgi:ABC-2 type transport system permease protein